MGKILLPFAFLLLVLNALFVDGALAVRAAASVSLGRLAYAQDGEMWIKELPAGEATRLLPAILKPRAPRWSPSGEWLAYHDGEKVGIVRQTGGDARVLQRRAPIISFAWSPLMDTLAYATQNNEIWTVNADGSGERRIIAVTSSNPAEKTFLASYADRALAWSPDGQWLAYVVDRLVSTPSPHNNYSGLWRVRANGQDASEVYNTGEQPSDGVVLAQLSPDDRNIFFWLAPYFSGSILADGVPLNAIPINGGVLYSITQPLLLHPDFLSISPDRRYIAISAGNRRDTWMRKQIVLADLATRQNTPLTDEQTAAISPSWSPDSKRIAYVTAPDVGDVVGGPPAKAAVDQRRIWLMNRDGTDKPQLTHDAAYRDERPLWSADGSHVLFARLDQCDTASLWLMRVDGSDLTQVVDRLAALNPYGTWFGNYGHINWDDAFDWWQGAPPVLPQTGGEASSLLRPSAALATVLLGLVLLTAARHVRVV